MPLQRFRHALSGIQRLVVVLWLGCSAYADPLGSDVIAPGILFNTYRLPTPNDVFVLQIERGRAEYEFHVGWPGNQRNFAARTNTTAIIASAEQAGMNVIGAVNASFFDFESINVSGATASSGQILQPPTGFYDTVIIGTDHEPVVVEDIASQSSTLTLANGNTLTLDAHNQIHTADQLTLYTDNWGTVTHTLGADAVAFVIDELSGPSRAKRECAGIITAKVTGDSANNYPVPTGGAVLLGDTSISVLQTVAVGQRLHFNIGASASALNNVNVALTGVGHLLENGVRDTANWTQYGFSIQRHPRTVWAWNDDYWFLMVVDGRSGRSVGMDFSELADFLEDELAATDAVNLDGGGSSTMVVDGVLRNIPSDGQQRAIANALLLISAPTNSSLPFTDDFDSAERRGEWDDKFTFNDVTTLTTPSGDDAALLVQDPAGGVETVRAGKFGDRNYAMQASVLCERRVDDAPNGYERYALFARDSGTGALGLPSYGGGNCYAMTYDSNTGQLKAGIYRDGALTDFSGGGFARLETAWRQLRIECFGERIRYLVDGELLADVTNIERGNGFYGLGYHEFFNDNGLINGTRVDDVVVTNAFGDSNGDDEIGFYDTQAQSFCFNGPDSDFAPGFFCRHSDLDGDADVDTHDAVLLQQFYGLTAP